MVCDALGCLLENVRRLQSARCIVLVVQPGRSAVEGGWGWGVTWGAFNLFATLKA